SSSGSSSDSSSDSLSDSSYSFSIKSCNSLRSYCDFTFVCNAFLSLSYTFHVTHHRTFFIEINFDSFQENLDCLEEMCIVM
ncbi:21488_t:CDS:1, partial [Racocetra persica]